MSLWFIIVGSLWLAAVLATWFIGQRRQMQTEIMRILQWAYAVLALMTAVR